jgi:hypothetical protein
LQVIFQTPRAFRDGRLIDAAFALDGQNLTPLLIADFEARHFHVDARTDAARERHRDPISFRINNGLRVA